MPSTVPRNPTLQRAPCAAPRRDRHDPATMCDPLTRLLARAVATRGSAAGRGTLLLQRTPATAAAALRLVHPTATALKPAQLTSWLKQRADSSGTDRRNNAQVHGVDASSLGAINAELAKLPLGSEVKEVKPVEIEQKTKKSVKSEPKGVEFPHGGKHRPHVSDRQTIIESTKSNDAKYFWMDPQTVIDLEIEALKDGLKVAGDFTTVHRFEIEIGADSGESTQCLRMDGEHHGHPIVEKSTATASFHTYIAKDLAEARVNENEQRLARITSYLKTVGLSAATFETQVKKHMAPLKEQKKNTPSWSASRRRSPRGSARRRRS